MVVIKTNYFNTCRKRKELLSDKEFSSSCKRPVPLGVACEIRVEEYKESREECGPYPSGAKFLLL